MKVDFIDNNHFIIYYLFDESYRTEEDLKALFKLLNCDLSCKYSYRFHGFYNVTIFCSNGIYIFEFENIDDYGRGDFNITMLLNSVLLYEFDDLDIIKGDKLFYKNKFYVEIDSFLEDIHLFEYGNIVYGDRVNEILNNGILVKI